MDDHYMSAVAYWKQHALAATNRADALQRQAENLQQRLDRVLANLVGLGWECVCEQCREVSQRHALLAGLAGAIRQRVEFLEMREELKAMLEW